MCKHSQVYVRFRNYNLFSGGYVRQNFLIILVVVRLIQNHIDITVL